MGAMGLLKGPVPSLLCMALLLALSATADGAGRRVFGALRVSSHSARALQANVSFAPDPAEAASNSSLASGAGVGENCTLGDSEAPVPCQPGLMCSFMETPRPALLADAANSTAPFGTCIPDRSWYPTAGLGEACSLGVPREVPCGQDLLCNVTLPAADVAGAGNGTCVPFPWAGEGEQCSFGDGPAVYCRPELYCNTSLADLMGSDANPVVDWVSGTCVALVHVAEGEACTLSADGVPVLCQQGLWCASTGAMQLPSGRTFPLEDPSNPPLGTCISENSTTPAAQEGEECHVGAVLLICSEGLSCNISVPEGAIWGGATTYNGTCVKPTQVGENETCTVRQDGGVPIVCQEGLYCSILVDADHPVVAVPITASDNPAVSGPAVMRTAAATSSTRAWGLGGSYNGTCAKYLLMDDVSIQGTPGTVGCAADNCTRTGGAGDPCTLVGSTDNSSLPCQPGLTCILPQVMPLVGAGGEGNSTQEVTGVCGVAGGRNGGSGGVPLPGAQLCRQGSGGQALPCPEGLFCDTSDPGAEANSSAAAPSGGVARQQDLGISGIGAVGVCRTPAANGSVCYVWDAGLSTTSVDSDGIVINGSADPYEWSWPCSAGLVCLAFDPAPSLLNGSASAAGDPSNITQAYPAVSRAAIGVAEVNSSLLGYCVPAIDVPQLNESSPGKSENASCTFGEDSCAQGLSCSARRGSLSTVGGSKRPAANGVCTNATRIPVLQILEDAAEGTLLDPGVVVTGSPGGNNSSGNSADNSTKSSNSTTSQSSAASQETLSPPPTADSPNKAAGPNAGFAPSLLVFCMALLALV